MPKHLSIKPHIVALVFASLFLVSSLAMADWVELDPSPERSFQMFYEPSSIKKNGDISFIKVLKNFNEAKNSVDPNHPYTFWSQVAIQEIDCSKNKYRHKRVEMWSSLNGVGKLEQVHEYDKKSLAQPIFQSIPLTRFGSCLIRLRSLRMAMPPM